MPTPPGTTLSPRSYEWTCRAMAALERMVKVRIHLHDSANALESGDIFLFNHFARFETFIPQYLIYQRTGAYSRSVADKELFRRDNAFARYLRSLGALPTNLPDLLPFLVAEVLRGRKVVVFPEGGMVKDRRVLDPEGHFSVYSRMSNERRKHHTGAAVVALAAEAIKFSLREARRRGQDGRIRAWARSLEVPASALLDRAERPTRIAPCAITFHPIRITTNPLNRLAELLRLDLSPRLVEELLIEGNLLLRDTDMDLRMAEPILPSERWSEEERFRLLSLLEDVDSVEGLFALAQESRSPWLDRKVKTKALEVRDLYMERLYTSTVVNLSHLAATLALHLLRSGRTTVPLEEFHRALYLAVKKVQKEPTLHLHRGLLNPERYRGLLDGPCACLETFLQSARDLIEERDDRYLLLPKLQEVQAFDRIRIENAVMVYANEVAPLAAVQRAVEQALAEAPSLGGMEWIRCRFDDRIRAFRWDWQSFLEPQPLPEPAEAGASLPVLHLPDGSPRRLGVLMMQADSDPPGPVDALAHHLAELGFPHLGVRVHGQPPGPVPPERRWLEWMAAVREGYDLLATRVDRILLVGLSAGAALGLRLAAESPDRLAGLMAVAPRALEDEDGAELRKPLPQPVPSTPSREPRSPQTTHRVVQNRKAPGSVDLGQVRCPILVLQARFESSAGTRLAQGIFQGAASTLKRLVEIPSASARLFEDGNPLALEALLAFAQDLDGSLAGRKD